MEDLRIGVIGVGGRGKLAGHAHRPQDRITIVGGADPSDAARAEFARKYDLPPEAVTADYRPLLERKDIHAVFVTSPDDCHEDQAADALATGKHVYLEKPMAITIAGCDRILRAAAAGNARLYLGHNMRHMAFTQTMKARIDQGAIGEPRAGWCRHFVSYGGDAYFKDWHAERRRSTSLLLQKGAHDIDILHWLCGGYTRRVTAFGNLSVYNRIPDRHPPEERGDASWNNEHWPPLSQTGLHPVIDVEDLNMMLMELDNGVLCSYQQCHYTPDGWRNYTVIGTEGRIENFGDSPGHCVVRVWNRRCHYNPDGDEQHVIPAEPGGHGGADPKIVGEFLRYIREGGDVQTPPLAARQSVAAGCLGAESLRNGGRPMDIPPPPDDGRPTT